MKSNYRFYEFSMNTISLIHTKIFFKKARLIRMPFYLRGKKRFKYGKGFTTGYNCRFEVFDVHNRNSETLVVGENFKIGDYVHIAAGEEISIGDNCLIASKVYISDISHGDYSEDPESSSPTTPPDERPLNTNPIKIGDNVWIGDNVCILPGVNIGNGCVIGANAVVNKDIPDNCIAVGIPARIIKKYDISSKSWKKFST